MIFPVGYRSIESYLEALLNHYGGQRGFRSRLAEALKCHRSHISHLIAGTALLTLEQADALTLFLELDELESDYLLELVQLSRAGTQNLRLKIKRRMLRLEKEKKLRMGFEEPEVSPTDRLQTKRYSRWWYSAIHLAVASWKGLNTKELGMRFNLSKSALHETLLDLQMSGIFTRTKSGWASRESSLEVNKGSELSWIYAVTWRNWVLGRGSAETTPPETRYTGLLTLSEDEATWIRSEVTRLVQELREKTKQKPGPEMFYLGIDFLRVTGENRRSTNPTAEPVRNL